MERFGLRNDQWERIKDVLPGREATCGHARQPAAAVRAGRAPCPVGRDMDQVRLGVAATMSRPNLSEIYEGPRPYQMHRWHHYIPIYERHFSP